MPFGKSHFTLEIPTKNLQRIYHLQDPPALEDENKAIKNALQNPIKVAPLSTIIGTQDRVTIIIDDITRPTPSDKLVSAILSEISTPLENIQIVVATGLHRPNSESELRTMLGPEIVENIKIVNHNAFNKTELEYIGITRSGTIVEVNKTIKETDKVITTGHIEPHEFAGFTGGRKSIFPGVVGVKGINHNHRLEFIDHPKAKIGILEGNPIHEDMVEAAEMIGIDFMVNVVIDSKDNRVMKVVAGDFREAHQQGVEYYKKYAQVEIKEPADIVITSTGAPLDINFYQAVKAIFAVEPFVKRGGIIIHLAECPNGLGTSIFSDWMTSFSSPNDVINRIQREGYRGDIDHCYLLAKIIRKSKVIVVSPQLQIHEIKQSFLTTTVSPAEALNIALKKKGLTATIAALPFAQRLIPKY
jgi:nickel-dependent lactate racemase